MGGACVVGGAGVLAGAGFAASGASLEDVTNMFNIASNNMPVIAKLCAPVVGAVFGGAALGGLTLWAGCRAPAEGGLAFIPLTIAAAIVGLILGGVGGMTIADTVFSKTPTTSQDVRHIQPARSAVALLPSGLAGQCDSQQARAEGRGQRNVKWFM